MRWQCWKGTFCCDALGIWHEVHIGTSFPILISETHQLGFLKSSCIVTARCPECLSTIINHHFSMTFTCSLNNPAHFENGIRPGTRRRGAIIALTGSPQRRGLHSSTAALMKKRVWVYNGPGAGERSVESTVESLRGALQANVEVRTFDGSFTRWVPPT